MAVVASDSTARSTSPIGDTRAFGERRVARREQPSVEGRDDQIASAAPGMRES